MSVTAAWNVLITFLYPPQKIGEDGWPEKDYSDEIDREILNHCKSMFTGNAAFHPGADAYFDTKEEAENADKRIQDVITRYGGRVL